jgi:hypothetical protein
MLKITRIDTDAEQRLILEGRLANPCIADLSSHWTETRHAHPERDFVVDLVMWDSRDGELELTLRRPNSHQVTVLSLGHGFVSSWVIRIYPALRESTSDASLF